MRKLQGTHLTTGAPNGPLKLMTIGAEVGTGRDGTVYRIEESPRGLPLGVKIFNRGIQEGVEEYIDELLRVDSADWYCDDSRTLRITLPVAKALSPPDQRFVGYFLPFLGGPAYVRTTSTYRGLFRRSRHAVTWECYLKAASSLADTVDALHRRGIFVGDLALENTFLSPRGTLTLIDTDSFSLPTAHGRLPPRHFRPEYTPPEFLWRPESITERDAGADHFALAVAIAKLLLENFHPFAGLPLYDPDEDDRDEAVNIRNEANWITNPDSVSPPPAAPTVDLLPPPLLELFWEAFEIGMSDTEARPTAARWRDVLTSESQVLNQCVRNPRHVLPRHIKPKACYWCRRKAERSDDPFPPLPDGPGALPAKPNAATGARQPRARKRTGGSGATAKAKPQRKAAASRSGARPAKSSSRRWVLPKSVPGCPAATVSMLNTLMDDAPRTAPEPPMMPELVTLIARLLNRTGSLGQDGIKLDELEAWLAAVTGGEQLGEPLSLFLCRVTSDTPLVVANSALRPR